MAGVLQFQLYRALCQAAGQRFIDNPRRPLHRCDFYRNPEAGGILGWVLKNLINRRSLKPDKQKVSASSFTLCLAQNPPHTLVQKRKRRRKSGLLIISFKSTCTIRVLSQWYIFLRTPRSIATNNERLRWTPFAGKSRKVNVSYVMLANHVTFLRLEKLRHYFATIFQCPTRNTK